MSLVEIELKWLRK